MQLPSGIQFGKADMLLLPHSSHAKKSKRTFKAYKINIGTNPTQVSNIFPDPNPANNTGTKETMVVSR